ncbi:hypothetical protein [uncultured Sphingomonas sp.]|uniref:hypothetical protein n=1 Tax=uncultured Sphingomonas sp. TaxID=158754 RepID=UPI0035CA4497
MRFALPVMLAASAAVAAQDAPGWTPVPGSPPSDPVYVRIGRTQTVAQVTPRVSLASRVAARAFLREFVKRGLCPAGATTNADAESAVAVSQDADRRCIAIATPLPGGGSRVVIGRTAGPDRLEPDSLVRAVAELASPTFSVASPVAITPTPPSPPSAAGARPVGAILRGSNRLQGVQLQLMFTVTPWLLYANGVAAPCPDADPAALPLDPAALDARDGCEGGRWRRGAAGIEFQEDEGDDWSSDQVWEQRSLAPGTALDFDGLAKGGSASYAPLSGIAAFTELRNGRLRLAPDGRIEGAMVTTAGYNAKSTTKTGLVGRYRVDGFTIEIVTSDGATIRRPFVFSEQDSKYRGAYFADEVYLQPKA